MHTQSTHIALCGGRSGKPCGKELRTPADGVILFGYLHHAGPLVKGSMPDTPVLAGKSGETTAWCWGCLLDESAAPQIAALKSLRAKAEEAEARAEHERRSR